MRLIRAGKRSTNKIRARPGRLCYSVTDAPLRLTGLLGRIVQRIFGPF